LREERLISHNVLVAGGTIVAGGLGFVFQIAVSHRLHPSDYASVFAAMTLLTLITLPASALTLLMARETSRDRAIGHSAASAALLRTGNRTLLIAGIVLGILFAGGSPWIGAFFSLPAEFVVAVAVGMPVALALPLLMGELQGQQRFLSFSTVNVGQAVLKLGDMELDPRYIKGFIAVMESFDCDAVVGSKRHPMSNVHYPPARRFQSLIYQLLIQALFRVKVRDTQTGLKLFRRKVLEEVVPLLAIKRFAFDLELLVVARQLGYKKVMEAPVDLNYAFDSTADLTATWHVLWDTAAIFYRLRFRRFYARQRAASAGEGGGSVVV
jgi:hypothetical protein